MKASKEYPCKQGKIEKEKRGKVFYENSKELNLRIRVRASQSRLTKGTINNPDAPCLAAA